MEWGEQNGFSRTYNEFSKSGGFNKHGNKLFIFQNRKSNIGNT